jgi:DNA-binding MarR family transcriptional regulator
MQTSETPSSESLSSWMGTLIGYVQSARPDLTNRQMALLLVVYLTDGPHTVRGLAGRLKVSKPVVTRALNTLGALGYLRRQKDESDLRNIFVERTPQGTTFLDEFKSLIERTETRNPRH